MNSNELPKKRKFIQFCIYYSLRCNSLWVMFKLAGEFRWKRGRLPCFSFSIRPSTHVHTMSIMSGKHSLLHSPEIMSVTHDTTLWHYYFGSGFRRKKKWKSKKNKKTTWKIAHITRFETSRTKQRCAINFGLPSITNFRGRPRKHTERRRRRTLFQPSNYIHVKLVFTAKRSCRKEINTKHSAMLPRSSSTDIRFTSALL